MEGACAKCILPTSVYLDTDIIHAIKRTKPPPQFFGYGKRSKTGLWESLGTRLNQHYAMLL